MANTVTALAEAVLEEIKDDCFGTGKDARDSDDLRAVTVDGIIDLHAVVRAVLTALKDCPTRILTSASIALPEFTRGGNDGTNVEVELFDDDLRKVIHAVIDAILQETA